MDLEVKGIQFNGQSKVCSWYRVAFPHDDWGNEMMNKGITFQDVSHSPKDPHNSYTLPFGQFTLQDSC